MSQTSLILFMVAIAAIMVVFYFNTTESVQDKLTQDNSDQDISNDNIRQIITRPVTESFDSSKKGINYFGGHHCPHSRENSSMYNLINERLRKKYPDIQINIYWASEHDDLFNKYNVEFVPTLLNNSGNNVVAGLPEDVNRENKTDKELEEIVLENISKQL